MRAFRRLARSSGTFLLEDAAHAFGAEYRGEPVGGSGHAVFSFYATKSLTTGEGGMITTTDRRLADRLRLLRLHGISRNAWKRYTKAGDWRYEVLDAGFKYNMTDTQAAMGIVQLQRAKGLRAKRRAQAKTLKRLLAPVATVQTPVERSEVLHAWHLFPILLDLRRLRIGRARFIDALRAENIGTSVHFMPLHLQPYYRQRFGYRRGDFPVAEGIYDRLISLPLYPSMTRADLEDVADAVSKVSGHYSR